MNSPTATATTATFRLLVVPMPPPLPPKGINYRLVAAIAAIFLTAADRSLNL